MPALREKLITFRIAKGVDIHAPVSSVHLVYKNMYVFLDNLTDPFRRGDLLVYNHEQKVWAYHPALDSFRRSCAYTVNSYGWHQFDEPGQIGLIIRLIKDCLDMNGRMRSWSKLTPDQRAAFTKMALASKDALGKPRHTDKIRLAWLIEKASDATDRLGRTNQGKSAAELIAAADTGYKLYNAMRKIAKNVEIREFVAAQLVLEEEHKMRRLHMEIGNIIANAKAASKPGDLEHVLYLIDQVVAEMSTTVFNPWLSAYVRCMRDDLKPAQRNFQCKADFLKIGMGSNGVWMSQAEVRDGIKRLNRARLVLEFLEFERRYANWMFRAFQEMKRQPAPGLEAELHLHRIDALQTELQIMRESVKSEGDAGQDPVNIDDELRSYVIKKWYDRTGIALFYMRQRRFGQARDAFVNADNAW